MGPPVGKKPLVFGGGGGGGGCGHPPSAGERDRRSCRRRLAPANRGPPIASVRVSAPAWVVMKHTQKGAMGAGHGGEGEIGAVEMESLCA